MEASTCVWMAKPVRQLMWFWDGPRVASNGPLLFILYTSELFHIVGSPVVGYAYDASIYAVIPK